MNTILRNLSVMMTVGVLSSCSLMGQKSCSGTDADLDNPACTAEITKKMYRDNDQRWYCVGLVAGEAWTCGASLSEAQANRLPKKSTPNTAKTALKPIKASLSAVSEEPKKTSGAQEDLLGSVMPRAVVATIATAATHPQRLQISKKEAWTSSEKPLQPINTPAGNSALSSAMTSTLPDIASIQDLVSLESLPSTLRGIASNKELEMVAEPNASLHSRAIQSPAVSIRNKADLAGASQTPKERRVAAVKLPSQLDQAALAAPRSTAITWPGAPKAQPAKASSHPAPSMAEEATPLSLSLNARGVQSASATTSITQAIQLNHALAQEESLAGATLIAKPVKAYPSSNEATHQSGIQVTAITALLAKNEVSADPDDRANIMGLIDGIEPTLLTRQAPVLQLAKAQSIDPAFFDAKNAAASNKAPMPATELKISHHPMTSLHDRAQTGHQEVRSISAAISQPATTAAASSISLIATGVAGSSSASASFSAIALPEEDAGVFPESMPLAGISTAQPRAAASSLETPTILDNVTEALTANTASEPAIDSIQPFGIAKATGSDSKTPASSMPVSTINSAVIVPGNQPFPANTSLAEVFIADAQHHDASHAPLASLQVGVTAPARSRSDSIPAQKSLLNQRASIGSQALWAAEETPTPQTQAVADLSRLDQLTRADSLIEFEALESPATSGDATYDYFMDLPLDDFAVQLKADKTLRGILRFASSVDLADPMVLKVQPLKKPLFVLVLDTFDDIQLASDAKQAWMSQFDNGIEPWIRTVGSLQKSMQPIGPMD